MMIRNQSNKLNKKFANKFNKQLKKSNKIAEIYNKHNVTQNRNEKNYFHCALQKKTLRTHKNYFCKRGQKLI